MIYLKPLINYNTNDANLVDAFGEDGWFEVSTSTYLRTYIFDIYKVKINDTIYTRPSPEFQEAYDKVRAWNLLRKKEE